MTQTLKNKIAVVTGSSRGIGRATALKLASQGALVVVHFAKNPDAAKEVVNLIEASGGQAFAIGEDLSQSGSASRLFAKIDTELQKRAGSTHIDILVNNAGIAPFTSFADTTESIYDELFNVNVKASYFIAQEAAKRLNDGGRIVNFSSLVSRLPATSALAYSMTKGSIDVLTRGLAKDLGVRNITVNAVAPGVIKTDMAAGLVNDEASINWVQSIQSLKRIGEAEDVADLVAFLVSDEGRWVTGQVIEVSGGSVVSL